MLSTKIRVNVENPKASCANKVRVDTSYSQDGHCTESYYVSYDPKDTLALFLLEKTLQASPFVVIYSVYDALGNRDEKFIKEQNPKRY